ncbi:dihydropteroate synthase [Desulfococcaceae bacterium HSG8]|nr:dihydropteroate synthase [Desulfococcaceae bacterium HSG8]
MRDSAFYAFHFTFHVSRFTFHALRFTHYVSRITFHVSRFTFHVSRFTEDKLILIADNLQIINPVIGKAVDEMNPGPIQEMVKQCETAGAEAIDINSGPLTRDPEKKMTFLIKAVQEVSDLPVLIDTANPRAMEAGLCANKKQAIINGFSAEPAKLELILPLAKRFDTDIIGYLLYPDSHVPPDGAERLSVAIELYSEFQKAGIAEERLIIDPVVAPVIWGDGNIQDMEILSVIRQLPEVLGFPVRTIAGLSNLTTGQGPGEKKLLLERTYLPMLAGSGLSMVLLNIFHRESMRVAKSCRALTEPKVFAWEEVPAVNKL